MNALDILGQFYAPDSKSYRILTEHGRLVAEKALAAAVRVSRFDPDLDFIQAAAVLHDIGIFLTNSPVLGCYGAEPYVRHGILGREILDSLGLHRHGLVCERHVGVGISTEDVCRFKLPLPERDMLPVTIEEQLICYADKFFSKNGNGPPGEKSDEEILAGLELYGKDKVARYLGWKKLFG